MGIGYGSKRSAEEREALRQGLTLKTEEQLEAALYEDSLESKYGDPAIQTGEAWKPQALIRFSAPGRDSLPTIDDDPTTDPHVFPRIYPAWADGETFVVSGPLGDYQVEPGADAPTPGGRTRVIAQVAKGFGKRNNPRDPDPSAGVVRGRWFKKRSEARKWALEKYGYIFEEVMVKGRWCFRVPMPGPAGAKHRPGGV